MRAPRPEKKTDATRAERTRKDSEEQKHVAYSYAVLTKMGLGGAGQPSCDSKRRRGGVLHLLRG